MTLTFASYNIHACIGTDGAFDPERIVNVIRQIDADVIALQEVEHHLVNDTDLLDFLAQQTSMHAIAGPTMYRETRHYGNAILTKHAFTWHQLIDLSQQQREPRGAIAVRLIIQQQSFLILATHFGLKPSERRHQSKILLNHIKHYTDDYVVLMGDLNEWCPFSRSLVDFKQVFGRHMPSCKSFPSIMPLFALDRIWIKPKPYRFNLQVLRNKLTKKASDHLPLIATLELKQKGSVDNN